MEFQTAYMKTKRVTVDTGEGLTEQAHKKECDMNYILKEYTKTGLIRHAKDNEGKYDDIAVQDFQEAMFVVAQAKEMFSELPALVRKRFGNDPSGFLDFVQDPNNKNEMARMGILKGNDGFDIKGAATLAPTPDEVKQAQPAPKQTGSEEPSG